MCAHCMPRIILGTPWEIPFEIPQDATLERWYPMDSSENTKLEAIRSVFEAAPVDVNVLKATKGERAYKPV